MKKNPKISKEVWLDEIEETLQESLEYLDTAKKIEDIESRCNMIEAALRENIRASWRIYILLKDISKIRS